MTIIDTYQEITALLRQMNGTFDKTAWERYIKLVSPELFHKVTEDCDHYDYNSKILPVMNLLVNNPEKATEAHESFLAATNDLDLKINNKVGTKLQVQLVFYVGLCNGAGWATTLDGKPTVLLGLEKIVELDWCNKDAMTALIFHELGHIWHDVAGVLRRDTPTMRDKYIWQMFQEGIAMYFEQLLTGDFNHYHQDQNGWLDWCSANKSELNAEYLRRLQANENAQDFFGDWQSYKEYSNIGYYIGCEFIKWLSRKNFINEIANFTVDEAYQAFCKYTKEDSVKLRNYHLDDCKQTWSLFYNAVHSANSANYTEAQLHAWTPKDMNLQTWNQRLLKNSYAIVAEKNSVIIGIGTADDIGYFDLLYVHKDYQRKGVATLIADDIEKYLYRKGIHIITTDASITTKPFFEKRGYMVQAEQSVECRGQFLTRGYPGIEKCTKRR